MPEGNDNGKIISGRFPQKEMLEKQGRPDSEVFFESFRRHFSPESLHLLSHGLPDSDPQFKEFTEEFGRDFIGIVAQSKMMLDYFHTDRFMPDGLTKEEFRDSISHVFSRILEAIEISIQQ